MGVIFEGQKPAEILDIFARRSKDDGDLAEKRGGVSVAERTGQNVVTPQPSGGSAYVAPKTTASSPITSKGYTSRRMDEVASNLNMGGKGATGSLRELTVAPSAYAAGALDAVEGMVKFAPARMAEHYANKDTYLSKRESEGWDTTAEQYAARNEAYKKAHQEENAKKAQQWADIEQSIDLYGGAKRSENALSARQLERMGTSEKGAEEVKKEQQSSKSLREFLDETRAEMELAKQESGSTISLADMAYTMGQMAPSQVVGAGVAKAAGKLLSSTEYGKLIMDNMLTAKNWSDITKAAKAVEEGTGSASAVYNAVQGARSAMLGEALNAPRTAGSLGTMYLQIYGNSFDEALKNGADVKTAADYAKAHAVVETGTEILGGGVPGMGEGIGTKLITNLAEKTAARMGGKAMTSFLPKVVGGIANVMSSSLGETAIDIIGEGVEEMISEIYDPWIAQRSGLDAESGYSSWGDINWENVAIAGFEGMLVSALMQGGVAILKSGVQNGVVYTVDEETGRVERTPIDQTTEDATPGTVAESVENGALSASELADERNRMAQVVLANKWNFEGLNTVAKEFRESGSMYERYGDLLSDDSFKVRGVPGEYMIQPLTVKNGVVPSQEEIDNYVKDLAEQNKKIVDHLQTKANAAEYRKRVSEYLPDTVTVDMLSPEYVEKTYNASPEIAQYMDRIEFAEGIAEQLNKQIAENPDNKKAILDGKLSNVNKFSAVTKLGEDAVKAAFGNDIKTLRDSYVKDNWNANKNLGDTATVAIKNNAGRAVMVDYAQFAETNYKRVAPEAKSVYDLTPEQRNKLVMAFKSAASEQAKERADFINAINNRVKAAGVTVKFDSKLAPGRRGESSTDGKTIRLNPNLNNVGALRFVYAHELIHSATALGNTELEKAEMRSAMHNHVYEMAKSIGYDLYADEKRIIESGKYTPAAAKDDACVRFLDNLLGDSEMLMALSDYNPAALHDLYEYLEEKSRQNPTDDKDMRRADAKIRSDVRKADNKTLEKQEAKEAEPLMKDIPQDVKDAASKPADTKEGSVEEVIKEAEAIKPSETEAEYEAKTEGQSAAEVFKPKAVLPKAAKDAGFREPEQKAEKPKKGKNEKKSTERSYADDPTSIPLAGYPGLRLILDNPIGKTRGRSKRGAGSATASASYAASAVPVWTVIRVAPDASHELSKDGKTRLVSKEEAKVLRSLGFGNKYGVYTHDYNADFWRKLQSAVPSDIESADTTQANKLREYKAAKEFDGLRLSFVNDGYYGKIRVIYRNSEGYRRSIPEELYYALCGKDDKPGLGFKREKDNAYGNALYAEYSDHLWELLGGEPMTRMMRNEMNHKTALRANLFESGDYVPCTADAFKGFDITYNALTDTLYLWKEGQLVGVADYKESLLELVFGDSNISDIFGERSADLARINEVIYELGENNRQRAFWQGHTAEKEARGDKQAELNAVFGLTSDGEEERIEHQLEEAKKRPGMVRVRYPGSDWEYYPKRLANQLAGVSSKGGVNRSFVDESYIRTNPAGGMKDAKAVYTDPETGRSYRYFPDSMPMFIIDGDTGKIVWDASKYDPKLKTNTNKQVKIDQQWFIDNAKSAEEFEKEYDTSNEDVKNPKSMTKEEAEALKRKEAKEDKEAAEAAEREDYQLETKFVKATRTEEEANATIRSAMSSDTTESVEQTGDTAAGAAAGSDITGRYERDVAAEADTRGKQSAADYGSGGGGYSATPSKGSNIRDAASSNRSASSQARLEASNREYYAKLREERDQAIIAGKEIAEDVKAEEERRKNSAGMTTRYANSYYIEELREMFPDRSDEVLKLMQKEGEWRQKLETAREEKDGPALKAAREKLKELEKDIKAKIEQEKKEAAEAAANPKPESKEKFKLEQKETKAERERARLEQQKQGFTDSIRSAESRLAKLNEDLEKEKSKKQTDKTRFDYMSITDKTEADKLAKEIGNLENDIKDIERALEKERKAEKENGKTEIKEKPMKLAQEVRLEEVQKRLQKYKDDLATARRMYEEKGFQRYKLEANELEKKIQQEKAREAKAKDELKKAKKAKTKNTEEVNPLEKKLAEKKSALAERQKKYNKLVEPATGKNWEARKEARLSQMRQDIVTVESDIADLKEKAKAVDAKLKKVNKTRIKPTLDELADKSGTAETVKAEPEKKTKPRKRKASVGGTALTDSNGAIIEPNAADYYKSKPGSLNEKGEVQVYYPVADTESGGVSLNASNATTADLSGAVYAAIESPLYTEKDTVADYPELESVIKTVLSRYGLTERQIAGDILFRVSQNPFAEENLVNDILVAVAHEAAFFTDEYDSSIYSALLTELGKDGSVSSDAAYVVDSSQLKDVADQNPSDADTGAEGFIADDAWWDNFAKQYDKERKSEGTEHTFWEWEDPAGHEEENARQMDELRKNYGTIEGTNVPKKDGSKRGKVTETVNSIWNAPGLKVDGTPLDAASDAAVLQGMLSYIPTTHKEELAKGQRWLQSYASDTIKGQKTDLTAEGFAKAYQAWMGEGDVNSSESVIRGGQLAAEMANFARENPDKVDPDMKKAWVYLIAKLASGGSNAGQTLNAYGVLKKLTAQGRLYYIENMIDNLRKEYENPKGWTRKNLKGALKDYTIPDHLLQNLAECKAGDQAALDEAEDLIAQDVADHIPATWESRLIAYRYLCMLGNGKTHVRNIVSNAAHAIIKDIARNVSGVLQDAAGLEEGERTVSAKNAFGIGVSEETKKFADEDTERMKEVLQIGGKRGFQNKIEQYRKSFSSDFMNALDKINSYGIESKKLWFLNGLEGEDWHYLEREYSKSLARYMAANNLTPEYFETNSKKALEDLSKAREYSLRQAWEATYRQSNILATKLNEIARKHPVGALVIGGIAPFLRTPLNIAVTGFRYSPLGVLETIYDAKAKVESGEMMPAEVLDRFAQNLTGSGLMILGMLLANMGKLKASGKESDREEYYDQMLGEQRYSIDIGGRNYTLDWLTPVSMPIFAGVELFNAMKDEAEIGDEDFAEVLARVASALSTIADPLVNLSMLSNVNEVLQGYGDENQILKLMSSAAQNYLLQFVPTMSGQLLRTIDPQRTTTYAPADEEYPLLKTGKTFVNKLKNKSLIANAILGDNNAYVDQWGRTENGEDNIVLRAFNQFIAPWYVRDYNKTAVDDKLAEVFAKNGSTSVLPSSPQSYYKIDGKTYRMSGDDFEKTKTTVGKLSYRCLEDAFAYRPFNDLDAETQGKVISNIYSYAREVAKVDYTKKNGIKYKPDNDIEKIEELSKYGYSPAQYYTVKAILSRYNKKAEKKRALRDLGIRGTASELFL